MKNKEQYKILLGGAIIGIIAAVLVLLGNPANMGFCIACFIRDTAGALGFHQAAAVQYIRPEIIGLVLGSFIAALCFKEFKTRGGSSPLTRFVLGICVAIGTLMFLGCPLRMALRLAGGDLNALVGLAGFIVGILCGVFFLKRGYSLKRTHEQSKYDGAVISVIQVVLLILLAAAPAFIHFTEAGGGPGALTAPVIASLAAGLIVGFIAQRTRLCMVGGIRDIVLFKDTKLILGFAGILVSCFIMNLIFGKVAFGFAEQPVAHNDGLWNALGMLLVGFGSALLGGCPLRQLVLSGEGSTDSAVTLVGIFTGCAIAHNFGLASSAKGPTPAGKAAVVICILIVAVIAVINTFKKEN